MPGTACRCARQPGSFSNSRRKRCCADFNKQTQHFLNFNVPRMHQETKPGEATPCQAESIVGTGVDFEKIGASAHDGEEKIYKYVQEPLRKWLANFDTVVVCCYANAACHLCCVCTPCFYRARSNAAELC